MQNKKTGDKEWDREWNTRGYGYPLPGSYEAAVMGTPAQLKVKLPEKIPEKEFLIKVIPDIKKPDIFFYPIEP